jgi:hypothetical protein
MPEPFKNVFNPKMITLMGSHLKLCWGEFDDKKFKKRSLS